MAAALTVALFASQVAFARVSSKTTLESQITALAKSRSGRSAVAKLEAELTSPAVARFPSTILHEYASVLTPFQRELMAAGALVASPSAQRLIAALSSQRRLRPKQARALAHLMIAVADNRAVKLLAAKGQALKRDPTALAEDLRTLTGPLPPEQATGGGSPAVASTLDALEGTQRSHAVAAFSAEMRKLLSNPRAVGLVQQLGPLDLTSLLPMQELSLLSLPTAVKTAFGPAPIARGAALESLSPETAGLIALGLGAAKLGFDQLVGSIEDKLLSDPYFVGDLPQDLNTAWDSAIRNTVGYEVADGALAFSAGFELVAGPVVGVLAGASAVDWGAELAGKLWPTTLTVSPAVETIPLGSVRTYAVDAIDAAGRDVGPVSASLTIAPPGTPCVDDACGANKPGHYLVIARDGTAEGTANLTVEAKLEITPMTFPTATEGVEFTQQLTATGAGDEPLHWKVLRAPPAVPGWAITDDGLLTGIPTEPGTGVIEVEVQDSAGDSATQQFDLTVLGSPIKIKPTILTEGVETEAYSQTLTAEGGEAPYMWAVTAGALPEGLTLDPTTGAISGTPVTSGTNSFDVTVTDKNGVTAHAHYNFTVGVLTKPPCAGSVCAIANSAGAVTLVWHETGKSGEYTAGPVIDGVLGGCKESQGQGCNYVLGLQDVEVLRAEAAWEQSHCQSGGGADWCSWLSPELGLLPGETIYFDVAEEFVGPAQEEIQLGVTNTVVVQ